MVRERVTQVFDDVERYGHMQAFEHAGGTLGIDARHDRVERAVHEVDARADARATPGQARVARRERDDRAGDAGRLHRLEGERAALREADEHRAAGGDAEMRLLAPHEVFEVGQHRGDALAMVVAMQPARWIPVLGRAAARVRIESARHDERRSREARLELECDRDHRLRSGAAAVQEDEQVMCWLLFRGGEAENPAGGHAMDIVTPP